MGFSGSYPEYESLLEDFRNTGQPDLVHQVMAAAEKSVYHAKFERSLYEEAREMLDRLEYSGIPMSAWTPGLLYRKAVLLILTEEFFDEREVASLFHTVISTADVSSDIRTRSMGYLLMYCSGEISLRQYDAFVEEISRGNDSMSKQMLETAQAVSKHYTLHDDQDVEVKFVVIYTTDMKVRRRAKPVFSAARRAFQTSVKERYHLYVDQTSREYTLHNAPLKLNDRELLFLFTLMQHENGCSKEHLFYRTYGRPFVDSDTDRFHQVVATLRRKLRAGGADLPRSSLEQYTWPTGLTYYFLIDEDWQRTVESNDDFQ